MKKIFLTSIAILLCCVSTAFAVNFVFPKPQGYVSDYANVIEQQTRLRIEQMARTLDRQTGVEMAVVVVKTTLPYDHLEYANRLFANWQIGKAGKDNGILLLLALNERKVKIETGYGVEDIIPDGKAGELLDLYVLPKLKEGNYSEGLYNGAYAIAKTIGDRYQVAVDGTYYPVEQPDENAPTTAEIIFFIIIVLLVIWAASNGWIPIFMGSGGIGGGWTGGSSSSSGSSFGSFGGGFGGFGGGMSGGGGASRGF